MEEFRTGPDPHLTPAHRKEDCRQQQRHSEAGQEKPAAGESGHHRDAAVERRDIAVQRGRRHAHAVQPAGHFPSGKIIVLFFGVVHSEQPAAENSEQQGDGQIDADDDRVDRQKLFSQHGSSSGNRSRVSPFPGRRASAGSRGRSTGRGTGSRALFQSSGSFPAHERFHRPGADKAPCHL